MTRICVVCGKEFPYGGRRTQRRYCSYTRRRRFDNAKEWGRPANPPEMEPRRCAGCATIFNPRRVTQVWCSKGCSNRTRTKMRRRGRLSGVPECAKHVSIAHRDHYICGLCSWPIDMELRYPDPGSYTIDHIVPLSAGGAHDWHNVWAAHWGCNFKKGARIPLIQAEYDKYA